MAGPEAPHWRQACATELAALHEMGAWVLAPLPHGRKALPCKWVFKRKLNSDGSLERYKARLVLCGNRQQFGQDYTDVFSPVARRSSIRLFFAVVASLDLECHQLDISNAFVQGDLSEHICMRQPPGFEDGSSAVCHLHKSLYGLKQAPRVWNKTMTAFLFSLGFRQSPSDGSVFLLAVEPVHSTTQPALIRVLLFVDDMLIAAADLSAVKSIKARILAKFAGKDLGPCTYFLQMVVQRDRCARTVILKQERQIDELVSRLGLSQAHARTVPMIEGVFRDSAGDCLSEMGLTEYRSLIGALNYLSVSTRPDIAFSVAFLSRFLQRPTTDKMARARDIVLYLKGTSTFGLHLGGSDFFLHGFADADWANCQATRRSQTGLVVHFGQGAVTWKSQRQPTVSRSTAEAEYVAAGEAAKEVQYLCALHQQLAAQSPAVVDVKTDNMSALQMIKDPISADRTKHIDIIYHHVRERVRLNQLTFSYVPSAENVADIFTKPLGRPLFEKFRSALGVRASLEGGC
jgi:Reverse transcriptase (RNA-dependent DNA polymerase)